VSLHHYISIAFALIFSISSHAQVKEYYIHDTSQVLVVYDSTDAFPDTVVKLKHPSQSRSVIAIYFDRSYTQMHSWCNWNLYPDTGSMTTWYRSGKIKEIVKRDDNYGFIMHSWYPDGKVKMNTSRNGDTTIYRKYYSNGQLASMTKGVNHGLVYEEYWCENGRLQSANVVVRKKHLFVSYYCNGKKKSEYIMYFKMPSGKLTQWYENGKLQIEGQYTEVSDEQIANGTDLLPVETGEWKYYNENGKLAKKVIYSSEGKVLKEIKY
jgi:antitoxin component YwqK of YwqJK toxin-antitoxin module